jgi:phosphatidylglycerophosphatase A
VRLWIAQGFGIGRIPFAPGTFGSLIGLLWFGALLATGNLWAYLLGVIIGVGLSVWLCGYAEKTLAQKDPGSVVLDEIAAMPVCFGSWIAISMGQTGQFPSLASLLSGSHALLLLGVFVAFRLFDIWKPWPVRQSQELPGGWGVTIDDVLAAAYVALIVFLITTMKLKWQPA